MNCDLCRKPITVTKPNQLKGICAACDKQLNGGKFSARIVKAEAGKVGAK